MKSKRRRKNVPTRICERCGNEMWGRKEIFKCRWCGWNNGLYKVSISKGNPGIR